MGFDGYYEASDLGRVRSISRQVAFGKNKTRTTESRILRPIAGTRGYPVVNLTRPGKRAQKFLHHVVLEAFLGERPDGTQACHNNGDRDDARLVNLRWDTPSSNHKDKRKHGTWQVGERANNVKLTEKIVLTIRAKGLTAAQASREFGLSKTNAARIVNHKTWTYLDEQQADR